MGIVARARVSQPSLVWSNLGSFELAFPARSKIDMAAVAKVTRASHRDGQSYIARVLPLATKPPSPSTARSRAFECQSELPTLARRENRPMFHVEHPRSTSRGWAEAMFHVKHPQGTAVISTPHPAFYARGQN